jgi:hypothetical protein
MFQTWRRELEETAFPPIEGLFFMELVNAKAVKGQIDPRDAPKLAIVNSICSSVKGWLR